MYRINKNLDKIIFGTVFSMILLLGAFSAKVNAFTALEINIPLIEVNA